MKKPYTTDSNKIAILQRVGRGFTLVELMIVVVIVGVLAAIIVPTAAQAMRARRGSSAASHMALMYRMAKMRSMGRGTAVLVRYQAGQVEMFEALNPTGQTSMPPPSCTTPADKWATCTIGSTTCVPVDSYKEQGELLSYSFLGNGATEVTGAIDICFTPAGQTYYREGTALFSPLTDVVPQILVWKGDRASSMVHTVFILPNGAARVVAGESR